ncbi:MAG: AraC family transcriptional regulator [Verrucomicrobiota bacterium]|jgi:AraC-like DNA-binding protein|nr:AraC family transcriptional regulator [Verrucomicrobiota bacterium]
MKPISNLHFDYMDTPERRVLDLGAAGVPSVPMLGYCHYRNPRPDVPEHWHTGCMEIHCCVRNALTFGFNGRAYRIGPGDLFVNLPGERHTVSAHPKGLVLYWLILRLDDKKDFLKQPPQEEAALRRALLNIPHRRFRDTGRVKQLFQTLHLLYDERADRLRTLRLRTTLLDLLLEVLSAAKAHSVPPGEIHLESIAKEIRDHPEGEVLIDELAHRAGMAPTHFITRFRMITGLPPRQYQLACRMNAARGLLTGTALPVTDIAMRLGFCTSQHFANLFKRYTGVTPRAWRDGAAGPHRTSDTEDGQSDTP